MGDANDRVLAWKRANPLAQVLRQHGVKCPRDDGEVSLKCPFTGSHKHGDRRPSFSANLTTGLWLCHGCGRKGDALTLHTLLTGQSVAKVLATVDSRRQTLSDRIRRVAPPPTPQAPAGDRERVLDYVYREWDGTVLFRVVRWKAADGGKTFTQERWDADRKQFVPGMEMTKRVLYRLPEVMKAREVWLTEGEKDVHTLEKLGFVATTNPGGADPGARMNDRGSAKWKPSMTEALKGKDVVLCGDSDQPGTKWQDYLRDELAPVARSVRRLRLDGFKDVSELFFSEGPEKTKETLMKMYEDAVPKRGGVPMTVLSSRELWMKTRRHVVAGESNPIQFGGNLAQLGRAIGPIHRGTLMAILGDTGGGKSALAVNMALSLAPRKVLVLTLELLTEHYFIRALQAGHQEEADAVREAIKLTDATDEALAPVAHILWDKDPRITVEDLGAKIAMAEDVIGTKVEAVVVDYLGLVRSREKRGTSYEETSFIARRLRSLATETGATFIVPVQVGRGPDVKNRVIGKHSAKDSGEVENSSTVLLTMNEVETTSGRAVQVRCEKNTMGPVGGSALLRLNPATMRMEPVDDLL